MNIRGTRIPTKKIVNGGRPFMETFYTYQDFYTHTKGVSYLLMIAALIGIALFWNFLSGKDDGKKGNKL